MKKSERQAPRCLVLRSWTVLKSAEAKEDREDEEARLWTVGGNYLEV